ncbi:MAG TPA: methyltransferase domain-containing protein [Candidatus Limnocylindria bacterium]|nr:methyltransferase domain-containing protein [Candidatus Limnocylindria bacterium]
MTLPHEAATVSDDLLAQERVRDSVRERYRGVIGQTTLVAEELYSAEQLGVIPVGAVVAALGVGNPIRWADLTTGERVVDLGCGAGIDTLLAARLVSPGGTAIGLDTLPEMLERAAANAAAGGITNVEWVRGELENIPLPDGHVDVVISNGVLNLSPRKGRALSEMFRALRTGGRLSLADIVLDEELPPEVMTDPDAWAG